MAFFVYIGILLVAISGIFLELDWLTKPKSDAKSPIQVASSVLPSAPPAKPKAEVASDQLNPKKPEVVRVIVPPPSPPQVETIVSAPQQAKASPPPLPPPQSAPPPAATAKAKPPARTATQPRRSADEDAPSAVRRHGPDDEGQTAVRHRSKDDELGEVEAAVRRIRPTTAEVHDDDGDDASVRTGRRAIAIERPANRGWFW